MNLQKLKREIEHQTRNGRTDIYIKVSDIKELTQENSKMIYGEQRIYIPIDYLEELIATYEETHKKSFRDSLKVPEGELKPIDKEGKGYYFIPKKNNKER